MPLLGFLREALVLRERLVEGRGDFAGLDALLLFAADQGLELGRRGDHARGAVDEGPLDRAQLQPIGHAEGEVHELRVDAAAVLCVAFAHQRQEPAQRLGQVETAHPRRLGIAEGPLRREHVREHGPVVIEGEALRALRLQHEGPHRARLDRGHISFPVVALPVVDGAVDPLARLAEPVVFQMQEGLQHRVVDHRARRPVAGRRSAHLGGDSVGIRPSLLA